MKPKTTKQLIKEAQTGAVNVANSKLCWELTNRSREMLAQEIYHLVMRIALDTQKMILDEVKTKQKSIIVD